MTEKQHAATCSTARAAAVLMALCVAILLIDFLVARARRPVDAKRIADLQEQVKMDAKLAKTLADEHDAITKARRARKMRIDVLAVVLIAASGIFLIAARRLVAEKGRKAVALDTIRKVKAAPEHNGHRRGRIKPQPTAAPVSTEIDLGVVDEIVRREGTAKEAAIPILQAIQAHFRYLPDEALRRVCETTEITPSQIAGTSSFYSRFRRSPVGEHVVRVCHGTACHVAGARQVSEELRRHLQIPEGADTDPQRQFTLEEVACLGCCSLAPVLMVDDATAGKLTPQRACEALETAEAKEVS